MHGKYGLSSMVLGIVKSPPLQMNMKEAEDKEQRQLVNTSGEDSDHVYHEETPFPADDPARRRRGACPASFGRDDSGLDGAGANRRHSEAAFRRLFRAARHGARLLDPCHRRPARRRTPVQLEGP